MAGILSSSLSLRFDDVLDVAVVAFFPSQALLEIESINVRNLFFV